jgi:hypothetical protein
VVRFEPRSRIYCVRAGQAGACGGDSLIQALLAMTATARSQVKVLWPSKFWQNSEGFFSTTYMDAAVYNWTLL